MGSFSFGEMTFFYIGLSGFMTVWTFRKTIGRKDKLSEFEYIGFSAFWGLAVLLFIEFIATCLDGLFNLHQMEAIKKVFENPFATGFGFSILGMQLAFIVGKSYLEFSDEETKETLRILKKRMGVFWKSWTRKKK
jgi:hypothetical protein